MHSDDEDSYVREERLWAEEAERAREAEEAEAEAREAEALERRQAAFRAESRRLQGLYQAETNRLMRASVRRFGKQSQALEFLTNAVGPVPLFAFARAKPSVSVERMKVAWKKDYMVGTYYRIYQVCEEARGRVSIDELVNVMLPCRVFFDIEINRAF